VPLVLLVVARPYTHLMGTAVPAPRFAGRDPEIVLRDAAAEVTASWPDVTVVQRIAT
jgi:hypothetical protein